MQGRPEPKHLLDIDADQNIGNGSLIPPQVGAATVVSQIAPERLLMLSGPSNTGQTTSIVLTVSRIVGPSNPYPGFPGPITGIIEFGNGGQFTRVEVDVPTGPFFGYLAQPAPATEPQDGGIIVTVPTGILRVYVRYDNLLLQPLLNTSPPQSLAQKLGLPNIVGPGGPIHYLPPLKTIPPEPVLAKAMAAYFSRHTSRVFRTNYIYVSDLATGVPIFITIPPSTFCVPAFARSLRVLRTPVTAAITVGVLDNSSHQLNAVAVAANSSPSIPIEGTGTIVTVGSTTASPTNRVSFLALCYEIGV
jgi:hypothetical protein